MSLSVTLPPPHPPGPYPSIAAAARVLGISREALRRQIQRAPDDYRERGEVGAACVPAEERTARGSQSSV